MVANIGRIDRSIRIALGIVLLSVVLLATGHWRWIGLLGVLRGSCRMQGIVVHAACCGVRWRLTLSLIKQ